MSNLPDWQDDKRMYAWLMAKLDDQLEAEMAEANKNTDHSAVREWLASDGPALEAAELYDDVTRLRERYPHLTHFIHPMRLPRGKHRPSRRLSDYNLRVRAAAAEVPRIRRLWQTHYRRRNRATSPPESKPEFFAAARWEVDEEDVIRLRERGKLKPK
jgi:hypothetical protein